MVERLAAGAGGVDEHAKVLARAFLADELVERLRAKRLVLVLGGPLGGRNACWVGRHRHRLWQVARRRATRQAAARNGEDAMLVDRRTMIAGSAALALSGPALGQRRRNADWFDRA